MCGIRKLTTDVSQGSRDEQWLGHSENSPEIKSHGGKRPGAGRPAKRAIERLPLGPRWYVARIVQSQSARILQDLALGETRRGFLSRPPFDAYMPTIAIEHRRDVQHVPMFHSYLFVEFDRHNDQWASLMTVDGLVDVISTVSRIPIPVPVNFVEKLKQDAPERLRLQKARMQPVARGTAVRIVSGPFEGHVVECISCDGLTTTVRLKFGNGSMIVKREQVA